MSTTSNKLKLIISLAIFICLAIYPQISFGQTQPPLFPPLEGEGGDGGSNGVQNRRDADNQQTEAEAEELQRLQEEDRKACEEEEAREYSIEASQEGGGRGGDDPYNPSNPDSPYNKPGQDPNGDDDDDGVPNNQDDDDDGNNVPDVDEKPAPAVVCNLLSQYITANEGWRNQRYTDSRGYPTIGIGHLITGNEPSDITRDIQETGEIDDNQVLELFSVDLSTYQSCAPRVAQEKGVNWSNLTKGRQIVLTDMAFNLGCVKLGNFNEMWKNIAEAQTASNNEDEELSWRDAANEIMDSTYASQVGQRASRNSRVMATMKEGDEQKANNDTQLGILKSKVDSEASITNRVCNGQTAWANPFKIFADLFQTPIALAQGLYVPVIEQDGILRRDTTKIRENTGKIEEHTDDIRVLSIQICTHLRAIRRIQSRFELKMAEDAQVKRTRDTELEKYRQAVFGENGLVKTGYTMLGENGEPMATPLFVTNQGLYRKINETEALEVVKDELSSSTNPYKDELLKIANGEDLFSLNSDIQEADFANLGIYASKNLEGQEKTRNFALKNIPFLRLAVKPMGLLTTIFMGKSALAEEETGTNKPYESLDFWGSWLKLIEPKNNRIGSLANTLNKLEVDSNSNVSDALREADQGQGFLPIRECVEKTSDGKNCAVWKTIQPAIIVKDTASKAINSRLDVYMNAKEKGDISAGNEPDINEIIENIPSSNGGGAVGPGMITPEDIPSNNEDIESDEQTNPADGGNTGGGQGERGTENTQQWGGLLSGLSDFFDNNDSTNETDMNWLSTLIGALKNLMTAVWNILRPLIVLDYKVKEGYTLIYWFSPNAGYCQAVNDWPSTDRPEGIAVNGGVKLSSTPVSEVNGAIIGSIKIVPPANTTRYEIKCFNGNGSRSKSKDVKTQ